jgi:hypothetical protein
MDRRTEFLIHRNPENEILHTVLVERNGFLHAMALGTKYEPTAVDTLDYIETAGPPPILRRLVQYIVNQSYRSESGPLKHQGKESSHVR